MTTLEALEIVLKAIKERFSLKDHTHSVSTISGLSAVAKTGRYSDLSGTPSIPSITVAKPNKVGLVMPGNGMYVDGDGVLYINADKNSGFYFDNGVLKFNSSSISNTVINERNWAPMFDKIGNIIQENAKKGIFDFTMTLVNKKNGKKIIIKFNKDKVENFSTISKYVLDAVSKFPQTDSFVKCDGYSESFEDFKYCELYKLLSSENIIDCVELYLYKTTNPTDSIRLLGKRITDMVKVFDYKQRYSSLGITMANYYENVEVTYVLKDDDYIPLSSVIGGGEYDPDPTPDPTPDPDPTPTPDPDPDPTPDPEESRYLYTLTEIDVPKENKMEGSLTWVKEGDAKDTLLAQATKSEIVKIEIYKGDSFETVMNGINVEKLTKYNIDFSSYKEEGNYGVKVYDTNEMYMQYIVNKKLNK